MLNETVDISFWISSPQNWTNQNFLKQNEFKFFGIQHHLMSCRDVLAITTAQLYSTKPELGFCAGSNPAHGVSEIRCVRISDNGPGWK